MTRSNKQGNGFSRV